MECRHGFQPGQWKHERHVDKKCYFYILRHTVGFIPAVNRPQEDRLKMLGNMLAHSLREKDREMSGDLAIGHFLLLGGF